MDDFKGLYDIRDYTKDDRAFVLATFLRGLYYGDSWFGEIPKPIFMTNYSIIAEKLIDSPKTIIKVACLPDSPDVILGYSILSADFQGIHWMYVKSMWRKKGIAKSLTPQYASYVTHLSSLGKLLLKEKLKTAIFNPFNL